MTSYAFNQRFGPDGSGYSAGDGGLIELTLSRCDPLPSGSPISTLIFDPVNPGTNAEDKSPIPWAADVPAGLVCITHRNIHAQQTTNWMSANELWVAKVDSPRQPAFPDDSLAVLSRGEFGTSWSVVANNTPVFDVAFADGHHEGQAYNQRFAGAQELVISGAVKVRERFTPSQALNVKAVWLRVQRKAGPGPLTVQLVGQTVSVPISQIPLEVANQYVGWVGGVWTRVPLVASLPAGIEQSVVFSVPSDTQVRVSPIRETYGQDNPFWDSRQFREGVAEKNVSGTWESMYFSVADLQFYLELTP